jgi:FMN phosphatase YigB (HAD superfamily)
MGAKASRPAGSMVMVVSLDALGTVYRFKEPFAVQYKKIAKMCGLKAEFETKALENSFRHAFKKYNSEFPNYGKGKMANPETWWNGLVLESFRPVIGREELPADLGHRLYNHFSSGSAYELFPDVRPFMTTIAKLRQDYSDPEGPMIILGIITNSDPRVRQVLNSLGLRVGPSQIPDSSLSGVARAANKETIDMATRGRRAFRSPYYDLYDSKNDFDFLATSYDLGYEKPDLGAFFGARKLASLLPMSRLEQSMEESESVLQNTGWLVKTAWEVRRRNSQMKWIHIGDDREKDFEGARTAGLDGLWLVRTPEDETYKPGLPDETVFSLEEAATVVSLMVQQTFG